MAPAESNGMLPTRSSRAPSNAIPQASVLPASQSDSRRTSSIMGPPPVPNNNSSLPSSPRPPTATMTMERSPSNQGQSQGPIRHPRPLTAAELHLELEKEQESIVNRLTRELSALRAQTASVASTASSTSDLFTTSQSHPDGLPYTPSYIPSGTTGASIIPTSARRHRSSSNLSTRSSRSAREQLARDAAASTSVSGVAAPRDTERSARQSLDIQRPETSRQNSYSLGISTSTSSGNVAHGQQGQATYRSTSNATSPYGPPPGYASLGNYRNSTSASHSRDPSQQNGITGLTVQEGRSPSTSFGSASAAARYEEAAVQRQELDIVKRENEALKQRIRDLERMITTGRAGSEGVSVAP